MRRKSDFLREVGLPHIEDIYKTQIIQFKSDKSMQENKDSTLTPPENQVRKEWTRGEKTLAVVLAIVVPLVFYITLDANKYRAEVRVVEGSGRVGVNPTTELLDFGDLSRGTSAVRRVNISNNTGIPLWIAVVRVGSISDLMSPNKNYFVLPAHSEETIEFTTYMPASGEVGALYSGRVFVFRIPLPGA